MTALEIVCCIVWALAALAVIVTTIMSIVADLHVRKIMKKIREDAKK